MDLMRCLRSFVVALVAGPLCACGVAVSYTQLRPSADLSPVPPASVELFLSPPPRHYVELGMIEVQQEAYNSDQTGELIQQMRIRAGRAGCDALIIVGTNNATIGNRYTTWTEKGYRGICAVWADGPRAPATAPVAMRN
ncbi:MAG: hypothetical protein NVS3B10_22770 [Polyangiales bacterium]